MSQRIVDGRSVASEEASQEFVDFWRNKVDPSYRSPYDDRLRRRQLEAFYFDNWTNLYVPDPRTKEIENSFMRMYEKGQTTTTLSLD